MDLDGEHVLAFMELVVRDDNGGCACCRAYVGGGVAGVGWRSAHEVTSDLNAIDISNETIVDVIGQFITFIALRLCIKIESLAEIIRWPLLTGVGAVVEDGGIIAAPVDAYVAVAKGSLRFLPSDVVGTIQPSSTVK